MSNLEMKEYKSFEDIKRVREDGTEFWYARELANVLEYTEWRNFNKVLERAKIACKNSGQEDLHHFVEVNKTIKMPKSATKKVVDYELTRYACYLIVQNGDPRKEVIAIGQTYFAVKTRQQEITEEEYKQLSEDERRLYNRKIVKDRNKYLFDTAKLSGVKDYAKFNNAGYTGLYNGETAENIAKRKGLTEGEAILDYMGSVELGANIFRITQTDALLKDKKVDNESEACSTHNKVGKAVRKAIKDIGGTMPENLPTPEKSISRIEKEHLKRLKNSNKKLMLDK